MANEIKITTTLAYAKGTSKSSLGTVFSANQTGDKYNQSITSVPTSDTNIDKGAIGTIGYIQVKNLDTVNYVQIGPASSNYSMTIKAGEGFCGPWQASAMYAKSNTSAVEIEYLMIEA